MGGGAAGQDAFFNEFKLRPKASRLPQLNWLGSPVLENLPSTTTVPLGPAKSDESKASA
jgi:hypothetical protein